MKKQSVRKKEPDFRTESERFFDLSYDMMCIASADGYFKRLNRAWKETLGWTIEELLKEPFAAFIHPDDVEATYSEVARQLNGETTETFENRYRCKDGSYRWLEWAATPAEDNTLFACARDITVRKSLEEKQRRSVKADLKELEAALAMEKKYSALQQKIVSLVSHEFRTPLTIIDSHAQRIIRRKDELTPEQLVERGEIIRNAVERMVELIDTTLYASRLDAGKIKMEPKPCDLTAMVRDICGHIAEISPSHDIHIDMDDVPDEILADTKLLEHVFINLISNAIKFAPDAPLIEVKGWTEGDRVSISVRDYGIGIPEDELPNMFERYFRAKTAEGIKGTGLGLSVVKEFVEMHGGTITVDSVEGEGSTFTVRLPINAKG